MEIKYVGNMYNTLRMYICVRKWKFYKFSLPPEPWLPFKHRNFAQKQDRNFAETDLSSIRQIEPDLTEYFHIWHILLNENQSESRACASGKSGSDVTCFCVVRVGPISQLPPTRWRTCKHAKQTTSLLYYAEFHAVCDHIKHLDMCGEEISFLGW